MAEISVKEYRKTKDYQRDAKRMARKGWLVVSAVTERETGLMTSFLGIPYFRLSRLLWPFGSSTKYVVTYQRQQAA